MNVAFDLDLLLQLRLTVARFGEMDVAKWWNTRGQLGPLGAAALRRGFPRTHRFAQARSVFAVAAHRCAEVFNDPASVTLWRLPEHIEETFDARWEHWIEHAADWDPLFVALERPSTTDLAEFLASRDLISHLDLDAYARLKRSAAGRAVPLPGPFRGLPQDLRLLALGFGRSEPGGVAVPYMSREQR